jgi:hypothetical protein
MEKLVHRVSTEVEWPDGPEAWNGEATEGSWRLTISRWLYT